MPASGRGLITLRYPTRGARKVIETQARRLPSGFGKALDQGAETYRQELIKRTPRGRGPNPGRLQAGWRVRRVGRGSRATRVVYNREKYLRYVLGGRGAIDQIASGRRYWDAEKKVWRGALRIPIGGRVLFRWRVGAAKANPFHVAAVRSARRLVSKQLAASTKAIIVSTS
jgi:hypothetical protein